MAHFEMDTFAKSHDQMSNFWNSCYDALMSSSLRREKEKTESRRKFQVGDVCYERDEEIFVRQAMAREFLACLETKLMQEWSIDGC